MALLDRERDSKLVKFVVGVGMIVSSAGAVIVR